MSDNIAVTAGSGTTVLADGITINSVPGLAQVVKVALGTLHTYQDYLKGGQQTAANSISIVGCSDTAATLPTIGSNKSVQISEDLDYVLWQGAAYQLTIIPIAAASSGDNSIVAAVASKVTQVVFFSLSFSGTVNATWNSDLAGSAAAISGTYYGVAGSQVSVLRGNASIETGTNKALNLKLSGATAVGGILGYFSH